MKNKLFTLMMIGLLSMFNANIYASADSDPRPVRSWWKTVLVDAAGALGGVGSVASISGYLSTTNPVGWGAMFAGGVIGAAGASLASVVPDGGTIEVSALLTDFTYASNESNENDNLGKKHNEMILEFANSNKKFTISNYLEYSKKLKVDGLNEALKTIDQDYLIQEFATVRKNVTEADVYELVMQRLPNSVDKDQFRTDLTIALKANTARGLIGNVKTMEAKYSKVNLNEVSRFSLNAFFSTLRYSAALWNK